MRGGSSPLVRSLVQTELGGVQLSLGEGSWCCKPISTTAPGSPWNSDQASIAAAETSAAALSCHPFTLGFEARGSPRPAAHFIPSPCLPACIALHVFSMCSVPWPLASSLQVDQLCVHEPGASPRSFACTVPGPHCAPSSIGPQTCPRVAVLALCAQIELATPVLLTKLCAPCTIGPQARTREAVLALCAQIVQAAAPTCMKGSPCICWARALRPALSASAPSRARQLALCALWAAESAELCPNSKPLCPQLLPCVGVLPLSQ